MSLNEVEQQAKKMAEREVTRRDSLMIDLSNYNDVVSIYLTCYIPNSGYLRRLLASI